MSSGELPQIVLLLKDITVILVSVPKIPIPPTFYYSERQSDTCSSISVWIMVLFLTETNYALVLVDFHTEMVGTGRYID